MAKLIKRISISLFSKKFSWKESTILSVLFIANLYFLTFQSIEIWTDFIIMVCYLYPVIATTAGFSIIYTNKPFNSKLKYLVLIFLFAYTGGSAENYSIGLILIMTVLLAYRIRKYSIKSVKIFLEDTTNKKIITAYLSLLIFSLIVYLAPGTENRSNVVKEFETLHNSGANQNATQNIYNSLYEYVFQKKTLYGIAFLPIWMLIGTSIEEIINKQYFKKIILFLSTLLIIYFLLTIYISYYVFSGNIAGRAWFPFNLTVVIMLSLISLYYGNLYFKKIKSVLNFIILPAIILVFMFYIALQIPRMVSYARSYDKRIEMLKSVPERNSYLEIEPLLPSGVIASSEITPDTSNFSNKTFIEAYNIKFNVALKTKD